jgi:hypothetical protein
MPGEHMLPTTGMCDGGDKDRGALEGLMRPSAPGAVTTYVSVVVGLVAAADLRAKAGGFTQVPVGADGQPLCWSLLPG